jgi:hypothetical protein
VTLIQGLKSRFLDLLGSKPNLGYERFWLAKLPMTFGSILGNLTKTNLFFGTGKYFGKIDCSDDWEWGPYTDKK